jgi:hypothetical protein
MQVSLGVQCAAVHELVARPAAACRGACQGSSPTVSGFVNQSPIVSAYSPCHHSVCARWIDRWIRRVGMKGLQPRTLGKAPASPAGIILVYFLFFFFLPSVQESLIIYFIN